MNCPVVPDLERFVQGTARPDTAKNRITMHSRNSASGSAFSAEEFVFYRLLSGGAGLNGRSENDAPHYSSELVSLSALPVALSGRG